ncbi:MAG: hypothetical protein KIT17_04760 [Rubrivivax sp.]|nr:hypothetical protein [Rubrivivax sp.]
MRPAPLLALRCPPSRSWQVLCMALGSIAGAAFAGWAAGHLELAPSATGVALVAGVAAGLLYGRTAAGPARATDLAWDGEAWRVDGEAGTLQVMLDLDRWLLLRWRAGGGAGRPHRRWVVVCRSGQAAGDVHALRAALYSRPPEPTPEPPHVRAPDRADP